MYDPCAPALPVSPTVAAYVAFAYWANEAHDPVTAQRLVTTVDARWLQQLERHGSLHDEIVSLRERMPYIDWHAPERRDCATLYVAARKLEGCYMRAIRASHSFC